MENLFRFLSNNKEWIFSGIGVFVIGLFITSKVIKRNKLKQNVKNNSFGIQVGNDLNINLNGKTKDE